MKQVLLPNALVVATDFSACSKRALETALSWCAPTAEITVLHVIDTELARRLEHAGLGSFADAMRKMHERAERELAVLDREKDRESVDSMVVEGAPFIEIIKIANDLDCDLIVLGNHGGDAGLTEILFGSTAEKVLRGARRPVLCIP